MLHISAGNEKGGGDRGGEGEGVGCSDDPPLTCKLLRDDKKLVALCVLRVEGLVQREMLLLEREHVFALDIREGCMCIGHESASTCYHTNNPLLPPPPRPSNLFPSNTTFNTSVNTNDERKNPTQKAPPYTSLTLLVAQRQQFAFTFADFGPGDGLDGEVVAGEGEGFFFHVEGYGLGEALGEGGAQRGVEGFEGGHGWLR